jgi:hypothetical protein
MVCFGNSLYLWSNNKPKCHMQSNSAYLPADLFFQLYHGDPGDSLSHGPKVGALGFVGFSLFQCVGVQGFPGRPLIFRQGVEVFDEFLWIRHCGYSSLVIGC